MDEDETAARGDESDFDAEDAGRAMTIPESSEAATLSDSTPPWDADVDDDADDDGVTPPTTTTPVRLLLLLLPTLADKSEVDLEKRGGGGGGCIAPVALHEDEVS